MRQSPLFAFVCVSHQRPPSATPARNGPARGGATRRTCPRLVPYTKAAPPTSRGSGCAAFASVEGLVRSRRAASPSSPRPRATMRMKGRGGCGGLAPPPKQSNAQSAAASEASSCTLQTLPGAQPRTAAARAGHPRAQGSSEMDAPAAEHAALSGVAGLLEGSTRERGSAGRPRTAPRQSTATGAAPLSDAASGPEPALSAPSPPSSSVTRAPVETLASACGGARPAEPPAAPSAATRQASCCHSEARSKAEPAAASVSSSEAPFPRAGSSKRGSGETGAVSTGRRRF